MIHRRDFLTGSAKLLIAMGLGTRALACASNSQAQKTAGSSEGDDTPPALPPRLLGTNAVYTSTAVEDHAHAFTVPVSHLDAPPPIGARGKTTEAGGHQHVLEVPPEALRRAGAGDIVKVETEPFEGHTHMFTIVRIE